MTGPPSPRPEWLLGAAEHDVSGSATPPPNSLLPEPQALDCRARGAGAPWVQRARVQASALPSMTQDGVGLT